MPLQNRVTPFGDIVALPGRGLLTGNRGVLHDDRKRIVRPWQSRRWIACELEYKDIRRTLMTPHRWTELFFLDEAAAFAAAHRPCGECRREEYRDFQRRFEAHHGVTAGADAMDRVLHAERLNKRAKRTWRADIATLPNATYVAIDGEAYVVWNATLAKWSDSGYGAPSAMPAHRDVDVRTPPTMVAILRSGYRPRMHPTLFA